MAGEKCCKLDISIIKYPYAVYGKGVGTNAVWDVLQVDSRDAEWCQRKLSAVKDFIYVIVGWRF